MVKIQSNSMEISIINDYLLDLHPWLVPRKTANNFSSMDRSFVAETMNDINVHTLGTSVTYIKSVQQNLSARGFVNVRLMSGTYTGSKNKY